MLVNATEKGGRYVRREPGYMERVYMQESQPLWRALLMFTGNAEVASDSMSEAFAQAIARGESIRDVRAWVWAAGFKIARGEMRGADTLSGEIEAMADLDPSADHRDDVIAVLTAMQVLPLSQRAAVILHHFAGYSLSEVAKMLGTSRSAVGVHLFRGRSKLRGQLEERDEEPR